MFYAANDYDRHMLAAVTGDPGGAPTLDRARALEVQKLKAKTIEEVDALKGEIGQEIVRYGNAMSGSVSRRKMIQRAWILWSVSAFVPLVFLWWSDLAVFWKTAQLRPVAEERSAEGARS